MDMDMTKAKQEIEKLTANLPQEKRVFDSAGKFYAYLQSQGTTLTLPEVEAVLLDLYKPKRELDFETLEDVAGGAQVEVVNEVKNNTKRVEVGPTVVVNM